MNIVDTLKDYAPAIKEAVLKVRAEKRHPEGEQISLGVFSMRMDDVIARKRRQLTKYQGQ